MLSGIDLFDANFYDANLLPTGEQLQKQNKIINYSFYLDIVHALQADKIPFRAVFLTSFF